MRDTQLSEFFARLHILEIPETVGADGCEYIAIPIEANIQSKTKGVAPRVKRIGGIIKGCGLAWNAQLPQRCA
jgi:hypothetical protein